MKRIGIFQYQWSLQIHTSNLAIKLAENGFLVDLYLYECNDALVNFSELSHNSNIRTFNYVNIEIVDYLFRASLGKRFPSSPVNFAIRAVNRAVRDIRKMINPAYRRPDRMNRVVERTLKDIGGIHYDCFIGIEKRGLIWAGKLSEKLEVPYLYYSLELFIEGHPYVESNPGFASLMVDERKYHAQSMGTIVQDAMRAKVLLESNGIEKADVIYLPVSITGETVKVKNNFLHRKLGIPLSKKIILYMGQIRKARRSDELIDCANDLGDDFVLVLHGPLVPDVSTHDDHGGKIFFSHEMVDMKDIPKIISSAYIGVAFYGADNANDRLTAFSSEKIAYYMQSGLPIIAHKNESFELLMDQCHCGVLIDRISRLPDAVKEIDANYDYYRNNAFSAYERFYSFDHNIHALTDYCSRVELQNA